MSPINSLVITSISSKEITDFRTLINAAQKIPQTLPWQNEISTSAAQEYLQGFLNNPKALIVFVYADKNLAAAGILSINNQNALIELICIDPLKHGMGIGPLIIDTLEDFAAANKCIQLIAKASDIQRLKDFYQRSGFTQAADQFIKIISAHQK